MIVISAVFVPMYYRLKVYTAYEVLEHRFDARVRYLGAVLFLIQRGLAAGITIYAPSIILSTVLGWPLHLTNLGMGLFVVAYTVSGGTRAVSHHGRTLAILARNLEAGEAPLRILGSLACQYRRLWKVKESLVAGGVKARRLECCGWTR